MTGICFVTFTRNSGRWLRGLLDNVVDVVDEIVVVDGYSSDDTVDIAKSYGARVFQRKPRGYADPDRMFAIRQCNNDWVLHLDTDERLNSMLRRDLKDLVNYAIEHDYSALMINRYNYSVKHREFILDFGFPDVQIRVFDRRRYRFKGIIHEFPKVYGRIMQLPPNYAILHLMDSSSLLNKKDIFYAYVERIEYTYSISESKLYSAFTKVPLFTPVAWSILFTYHTVRQLMAGKPINMVGLLGNFHFALYKNLTFLLIVTRGKRLSRLANAINKYGIIYLLNNT